MSNDFVTTITVISVCKFRNTWRKHAGFHSCK